MSILQKIVSEKKLEIENRKNQMPLESFSGSVSPGKNRFLSKKDGKIQIIAEIKRASPSKGSIAPDLKAGKRAHQYEKGGAPGISVLTDEKFFSGSIKDLREVKKNVDIPVLRKDFIIDEYQIYESALYGCDAVLLIARILERAELNRFYDRSVSLGIVPLVEVYSDDDLEKIQDLKKSFIGINNRNLHTFKTSLENSLLMAEKLDPSHIPIALSGVLSVDDAVFLYKRGMNNFLIGEYLSRSEDPEFTLKELINGMEG